MRTSRMKLSVIALAMLPLSSSAQALLAYVREQEKLGDVRKQKKPSVSSGMMMRSNLCGASWLVLLLSL